MIATLSLKIFIFKRHTERRLRLLSVQHVLLDSAGVLVIFSVGTNSLQAARQTSVAI